MDAKYAWVPGLARQGFRTTPLGRPRDLIEELFHMDQRQGSPLESKKPMQRGVSNSVDRLNPLAQGKQALAERWNR